MGREADFNPGPVFILKLTQVRASCYSHCDLVLEDKGGAQAIWPLLCRMLKMEGCSAVRMRSTCHQKTWG